MNDCLLFILPLNFDRKIIRGLNRILKSRIFPGAFEFFLYQIFLIRFRLSGVNQNMAGANLFSWLEDLLLTLYRNGGFGTCRTLVVNPDNVITEIRFNQFAGQLPLS